MTSSEFENLPHMVLSEDIASQIFVDNEAKETRQNISPLAKNERICFLTSTKTDK